MKSYVFWIISVVILLAIVAVMGMLTAYSMPDKGEVTVIDTPRYNVHSWIDPDTGVEYFTCYTWGGYYILLPRYDSDGEVMVHDKQNPTLHERG